MSIIGGKLWPNCLNILLSIFFLEGKYGVYHIQFFLIDLSIKFYNGSFTSNEIKFYHFE